MKKIIILLIVLATGAAMMTYLYFSRLNTENDSKDLALQSATNNAALIFSFQNDKGFYQILEGQQLLQKALGADKMMFLKQIKDQLLNDQILNNFISDQQIYVSILPDGQNQLNFLITTQINPDQNTKQFFEYLKQKQSLKAAGKEMYSLLLEDGTPFYLHIKDRVITASGSVRLIENAAIRLTENPFTAYIKASGVQNKNVLAQLYINFNQAPLLLKNILAGNLNGELSVFNKQNGYATLNYNFSKEKILFNGNAELLDADNYFKLFENTAPQNISITNLLPNKTAGYVLYATDNYQSWLTKLKALQKRRNETAKVDGLIRKIRADYGTDLDKVFPVYTKNQFISFQLATGEKLGAIALSNGEKVKQMFLDLSADYNEHIKIFKIPNILNGYFGDAFKKFERPYYTIIDNYLVFSNYASTLESFLNDYQSSRLLIDTPEYQDALNQLSSTSNIGFYFGLKNSRDLIRQNVRLQYYKHMVADSGLKTFDTFYFQMSADKNKFITNLLVNKYLKSEVPDSLSNR